jgi:multidrug resistance efflux pump
VTLISPRQERLARAVELPGTVQAYEAASLHPRVAGQVRAVKADIGRRVDAGDVLCELSAPELVEESAEKAARVKQAAAEVTQARKALAVAESLSDELKAGVTKAQAVLERWESEEKRTAALFSRGVADEQTRDEVRGQLKAAAAARDEARARFAGVASAVARAEADVLAALARRDVAEAEARRLQALTAYLMVRAPFKGVVTHRHVDLGDFVRPGEKEPLYRVAMIDPVRVVVQVPEADAGMVSDGLPATLTLAGKQVEARVTRASWALSPGARTLRVEADVPNPKGEWRPGMYAQARLVGQLAPMWTLPAEAVARLGDVVAVFRVEDGKAVLTPVELGHAHDGLVHVLRWRQQESPPRWAPFTGAEKVAARAAGLYDGQPVEVRP